MVQKNDELPIKAYLGVEALFKGTLSFDGIVRIDGKFEGKNTDERYSRYWRDGEDYSRR